jgi:hypothetical protein
MVRSTEGGEISATDHRNDGEGKWNVTLRKFPLAPLCQSGGMPDIAGRREGAEEEKEI